ncbi:hypothetical protein O3M35_003237 [Rhynocoris fuscipes]|uniref:Spaetzle domain-containing protein n=1 Tax=Rhynocoris fuscipes TaxID=488301 RepID=A0AAW1CJF3_9HEMI
MKTMAAALKKPDGRNKLGQVLPIVRLMSPPQRLALASLVMAQVLAGPGDPVPTMTTDKTETNVTSQLMLPISMDIAKMFRNFNEQPQGRSTHGFISELYQGGHRIRTATGPNIRRPPPTLNGINRRNVNGNVDKVIIPKRRPTRPTLLKKPPPSVATTNNCKLLANELCLELNDYPEEAIIKSIKNDGRPDAFKALLIEPNLTMDSEVEPKTLERRQGDVDGSSKKHMCSSTVEFARPKKARATSGQWKYIVNTGDYTQTLRLEICSKPETSCNYLSEEINSQCIQVYNYHRLLTWDETSGLTMDVFKVPTCCSCRVLGYGGIPFLQQTPAPTSVPPNILDHPDSNLVANDETPTVRFPPSPKPSQAPPPQSPPPSPPKGIRVRPFNPPKRETSRRPVIHKGPPLPLENEGIMTDFRYPPYDNTIRRYTRNNTIERIKFKHPGFSNPVPVTPNQRHPALPIDSLHSDSMPANNITPTPTAANVTPVKRINYSYHPIIDYFRPQIQQAESRVGFDWTPIINHTNKNLKSQT